MSGCQEALREEVQQWRDHFERAVSILESIELHADQGDERLKALLDSYEEVRRDAELDITALQELVAAQDLKQEEIEGLFNTRVEELKTEGRHGTGYERLNRLKKKLETRKEEDEGDLVVDSVRYSRKDHISKKDIANPVRNVVCKHVYDKDTIEEFIRDCQKRRLLCQCPAPSCPNKRKLNMKDMEPFPDFFDFVVD